MKQVINEDTGRISYIAENEEETKEFEQMAKGGGPQEDEEEAEDEDDNSSEQQQQQLVKSEKDKDAVNTVLATDETPIVVLPNRTPAQTEFMQKYPQARDALQKARATGTYGRPGPKGRSRGRNATRETMAPLNLSINQEEAPILKLLFNVLAERGEFYKNMAIEGYLKYAEELYKDLLTPADLKAQLQREEQERAAKEFEANYLEYFKKANSKALTDENIKQLAASMTGRDFQELSVKAETNYRMMLQATYSNKTKFKPRENSSSSSSNNMKD